MSLSREQIKLLEERVRQLRLNIVRMITESGSGHPGGALSAAEILAVLYFYEMRVAPERPDWPDRDRLIFSKGHACPVLYSALAMRGFFPLETLSTLRKLGSSLQGHPDMRKTPGVDMTTGSLGNGLSAGVGMALAGKLDKKDYRVFVILGCGELDEGIIWEAAMCASKYRLDNLVAVVDYNRLQLDGAVDQVMPLEPLAAKWEAFNWHVQEIDGHDVEKIVDAIAVAKEIRDKPSVIIAHTVKGKGVSFMENEVDWHGRAPTKNECERASREIMGRDVNAR